MIYFFTCLFYGIIKINWHEFHNNKCNSGDSSRPLFYSFSIGATKVSYPFEDKSEKDDLDRCWS